MSHAAIPLDEEHALAAARRGAPLGQVLGAFEGRRDPVAAALDALESWAAEGWIAAARAPLGAEAGRGFTV